jgi:hypothetical protein
VVALLVTLLALALIYRSTLLTQISGGRDAEGKISPYMDDVGEIQVALNVWGTIHMTGYPLYAILGNLTVGALRGVGVDAATAPALYTMLWGMVALVIFYMLLLKLTDEPLIAAGCTLLLGLARSIWIHNVIAEVYSMSLAFTALLLTIALWPASIPVRRRVWLLALIGGLGVAHHRLIALLAPGLLLAVWPELRQDGRRSVVTVGVALLIGLLGFLPYAYLPARALAGAAWVYGDPSTVAGLWHEFTGAEAEYLMQTPPSVDHIRDDFAATLRILSTELTPPLAFYCTVACLIAFGVRFRRAMGLALACVLPTVLYLIVQHRVVMPQATAMPIILVLILALGLSLSALLTRTPSQRRETIIILGLLAVAGGVLLTGASRDFISGLTGDDTGKQLIVLATRVPREGGQATLWLPWGPNFTAIAFSKYVTGENADLTIVAHNQGRVSDLLASGQAVYTARDTFYRYPLDFWDGQLREIGAERAYLSAAAEGVVSIRRTPLTANDTSGLGEAVEVAHGVLRRNVSACLTPDTVQLTVVWGAIRQPARDLSVFVHLLGADSPVPLAQADSAAPVFGWYPTTRWTAGEVVYDHYALLRSPDATRILIGMYEQIDGQFRNYGETALVLAEIGDCQR